MAATAKACPRAIKAAHCRSSLPRPAVNTAQTRRRSATTCYAEATETPPAMNPWQWYCLKLSTNPTETKACTSLIGFTLGDILAQCLEGATGIDLIRTSHLAFYGFFLDGPVGHMWYKWLDGTCDKVFEDPKGTASVATKTAADQLIWAPVISFKYVPSQQRILYNNVVAIFWNSYMSLVAADGGIAALGWGAAGLGEAVVGEVADTAADLVGLNDVAATIKSSMPLEKLFDDLLTFGSPMVQKAAAAAGESASHMAASPFMDAVLRMQANALQ